MTEITFHNELFTLFTYLLTLIINFWNCSDIDECIREDICILEKFCLNTIGNYSCNCTDGYRNVDSQTCVGEIFIFINNTFADFF